MGHVLGKGRQDASAPRLPPDAMQTAPEHPDAGAGNRKEADEDPQGSVPLERFGRAVIDGVANFFRSCDAEARFDNKEDDGPSQVVAIVVEEIDWMTQAAQDGGGEIREPNCAEDADDHDLNAAAAVDNANPEGCEDGKYQARAEAQHEEGYAGKTFVEKEFEG